MKNLRIYTKMLIVVDMVNGFVRGGVLHDENIARIIPKQLKLIKDYSGLVVFIKDTHQSNSIEFKRFGNMPHCLKDSFEAELVDELKPLADLEKAISIEKNSTSFMESPQFRDLVSKLSNIKQIDIVGCCTDICVFNGAMGLANYCDEHNQNVDINVYEDMIATYSEAERQDYVNAAKLLMEQQGIRLIKSR